MGLLFTSCLFWDGTYTQKSMVSFSFCEQENPEFLKDYMGIVDESDTKITIELPSNLNLSSLVANFEFQGIEISVEGVPQVSGVSKLDFTKPVTYVVKGLDDKIQTYEVVITLRPPRDTKSITFFQLVSYYPGYSSVITENKILMTKWDGSLYDEYPEFSLRVNYSTTGVQVLWNSTRIFPYTSQIFFTGPGVLTVIAEDKSQKEYLVTQDPAPLGQL